MHSRPYFFNPHHLLMILAALAFTGQMHASRIRHRDSTPSISNPAESVRFDLYQGYFMVAHGSVGPLKNLNFFVDTGASLAVVDSRIARKLHLKGEGSVSFVVVGGSSQGQEVSLPSLELGPVLRSNLPAISADLSSFQRTFSVRIDAIVGLDVLGETPFVIDYSARVIRFGPAPPLAVSVPLRLDRGFAIFDAEIDQTPMHLVLDTGAAFLVLFNRATPQSSKADGDTLPKTEKIGDLKIKQVRLRTFRLGTEEFRKKPALMARNPKPSEIDFDGLMSPPALGISRISVDLQGGVLAFSR